MPAQAVQLSIWSKFNLSMLTSCVAATNDVIHKDTDAADRVYWQPLAYLFITSTGVLKSVETHH
eukprot:1949807-Amphidinium_carterae.1